jgi:hypothetical protein
MDIVPVQPPEFVIFLFHPSVKNAERMEKAAS